MHDRRSCRGFCTRPRWCFLAAQQALAQVAGHAAALHCVDADCAALWPAAVQIFKSIGPVRELIVLRDKVTQESKGSAFVWYATGEDADKVRVSVAAACMHGQSWTPGVMVVTGSGCGGSDQMWCWPVLQHASLHGHHRPRTAPDCTGRVCCCRRPRQRSTCSWCCRARLAPAAGPWWCDVQHPLGRPRSWRACQAALSVLLATRKPRCSSTPTQSPCRKVLCWQATPAGMRQSQPHLHRAATGTV